MANPLETGIRYVGRVAIRTIGVDGFQREFRRMRKTGVEIGDSPNRAVIAGLSVGLIPQIGLPITYDGFRRFGKMDTLPLMLLGTGTVDFLTSIMPSVILVSNGHPTEAILTKLAVNAATHVGLDVIGAGARGVNRLLRNFRPSVQPH